MMKVHAQPTSVPGIGADQGSVAEAGESIIDYLAIPSPPPGGPMGQSEPGTVAIPEPYAEI